MSVTIAELNLEKENVALREELKRARLELRRAEQIKRDFIASLAHELRAPLTSLLGYTKILEAETSGSTQQYAQSVVAHARQLKHLVDDLVTLQQFDAGILTLRLGTLPLDEVVRDVIASQQREIGEKALRLEKHLDAALYVRADRERLGLVLTNLLRNAIRNSPRGGVITITARAEAARVVVGVHDHGDVIPQEKQAGVFARSHPESNSLAQQYNGLGLGLAAARTLVELHEGRIWIESALNQGNTFYFSLPRVILHTGNNVACSKRAMTVQ